MAKHIVITVFGSLGDLHPLMDLALGLQRLNYRVTLAASPTYQTKIESEGLGFAPLGPDMDSTAAVMDELFDLIRGPERLIKHYLLPVVEETAATLFPLLESADFLINSPTVYAGPVIATALKMPWASVALQPFLYFSASDPPLLPQLPFTETWHNWSPLFWKPFLHLIKQTSASWPQAVQNLRKRHQVLTTSNPLFEGQFSPYLNLALFSPLVGTRQPDWPAHTEPTGFLFYDRMMPQEAGLPQTVQQFLEAGEPPIVFTLGSSVVNKTTGFYEISTKVVKALGCRAIFLTGNRPATVTSDDQCLWWPAVGYSQLFPHARAVVHQGGMGTTAQTMRAGKPMIIVPHGFDQPDNAARLKRLGLSQTIYPYHYTVPRITNVLQSLLNNPLIHQKARNIGQLVQAETGLQNACQRIQATIENNKSIS